MSPEEYLAAMADTANRLDFEAHMNLISKQVKVYGVPGLDEVTYEFWYNQCQQDFANRQLKKVSYEGMGIISDEPDRKVFKSVETIESSDDKKSSNLIEFIIQKEDDGQWRVTRERILPEYELESVKQGGAL